ncbi:MAG TPA: hypothetical protein VGM56_20850 [Byssovorax sp.]|jgi:hypothetical protein
MIAAAGAAFAVASTALAEESRSGVARASESSAAVTLEADGAPALADPALAAPPEAFAPDPSPPRKNASLLVGGVVMGTLGAAAAGLGVATLVDRRTDPAGCFSCSQSFPGVLGNGFAAASIALGVAAIGGGVTLFVLGSSESKISAGSASPKAAWASAPRLAVASTGAGARVTLSF